MLSESSDTLTFIFKHLMQLHVPVGRDDLKINDAGDIRPLVLQQLQSCSMDELMGPFASLKPALSLDKGLAHVKLVAFVLEVAITIECFTFVVEQTDLGEK